MELKFWKKDNQDTEQIEEKNMILSIEPSAEELIRGAVKRRAQVFLPSMEGPMPHFDRKIARERAERALNRHKL